MGLRWTDRLAVSKAMVTHKIKMLKKMFILHVTAVYLQHVTCSTHFFPKLFLQIFFTFHVTTA